MTLAPGTPIGKYVVRRKIAEGGMAEIYLCASRGPEGFEKDVAIKRVKAFLLADPGFVKMFITEARVASKLSHANVVQIFDFDKHQDSYYLAMEYVRGQSLWSVRRRAKERMQPMPPVLVAHIGAEVARGLDHAHRLSDRGQLLGIVHRDVTPHNVLISYEGAVKLTDFGIAKAGDGTTAPGILKGKFAYMSPEQSRGEPVDPRTDIFALGVVLWEMLTGGRLFEGDGDVAILKAVQERVIPPPARLNPEVPAELDAAVMKALERDPAARYASAAELERALSRFLLRSEASVEDRDLGVYVRSLFADELNQPDPNLHPAEALPTDPAAPSVQPDTEAKLSADEDPLASTYVLPGRPRRASAEVAKPSPAAEIKPAGVAPDRPRAGARARLIAAAIGLASVAGWVGWRLTREAPAPAPTGVIAEKAQPRPDSLTPAPARVTQPEPAPTQTATPPPPELASREEPAPLERVERKEQAAGVLRVKIKPWGTVFLNGRLLGEASPELRSDVPSGSHRLTVKHRETWRRDVTIRIRPGQEAFREWTVPASRIE